MDEHIVISIARQYGSGGRTVGKMLAEKLGISFYDKEIIRMASDESGIDLGLFGKVEGGCLYTRPGISAWNRHPKRFPVPGKKLRSFF